MSIQWTLIAAYLYIEIAVVLLMLSPLFKPRQWNRLFRSRLLSAFRERTSMFFYGLIIILIMFLMDSIREMRKYSIPSEFSHSQLASELKGNVKLFRAQRNFYITGFAIFLSIVIKRLIVMINQQYEMTIKAYDIIKQATETVQLAKNTALTHVIQNNAGNTEKLKDELEAQENLLEEEKMRVRELEEECTKWRLKYEEAVKNPVGQGDN